MVLASRWNNSPPRALTSRISAISSTIVVLAPAVCFVGVHCSLLLGCEGLLRGDIGVRLKSTGMLRLVCKPAANIAKASPQIYNCYAARIRAMTQERWDAQMSDNYSNMYCDVEWLAQKMRQHKRTDLLTTLDIAGMAGVHVRDRRGNILPSVWTKQVQNMERESGVLLEANDMRKLLMKTLQDNIDANKDLVMSSSNQTVLVNWIKSTTESWELAYQDKLQERYDISTQIYAAMQEVYFEIEPFLLENPSARQHINNIKDSIRRIHVFLKDKDHTTAGNPPAGHNIVPVAGYLFDYDRALVRCMFRHPSLTSIFSRMAGKLLQKKEVLNKAGSYAAKVQRNDIVQEYNDAMMAFVDKVHVTPGLFADISNDSQTADFLFYIVDHAAISKPVSAAPVPLSVHSVCVKTT